MLKKIGILSLLAVAGVLHAEMEYEGRMEESVVTATGFSENVEKQIKNITVITRQDIKDKGYNSVEDMLRRAPGINFVNPGFGQIVDIRGQGAEKASGRVKILVDGVSMNLLDLSHGLVPINSVSVEDIERIEIIPGGGSVLYGNGTAGGVVNIITKKISKDGAHGKIYYQGSSYNTNKGGARTGIKFNENFSIDFGYENINGKGYREKDENSNEFINGGFTLQNEKHKLRFKATRYDEEGKTTSALTLEEMNRNRRQAGENPNSTNAVKKEYTLEYNIKPVDNLEFTILGYNQKMRREYDQDYGRGITNKGIFQDRKNGVNLKGNFDYGKGNLVFGYEYINNKMLRRSTNFLTLRGRTRTLSDTLINLSKETNSAFLLGRHALTDRLEGTLGYRYEAAKYKIHRTDGKNTLISNSKETNNAYEASLNFKYSDTGNVYAKYERGFRSPSPTELTNKDRLKGYSLNGVKPETYDTYEIGVKDMIFNSFISLTGFYTRTKDEISIIWGPGGHGVAWEYRNLDETQRKGFELFAEQYLGKLRINESVSYVDAKITKGKNKGQKIAYVPSTKATLGVAYDIISGLALKADVNYLSGQVDNGNSKIKGYSTTDLGVNYRHESGWGIDAGVKNVFGKKYYTFKNGDAYKPAGERQYYLGVNYEF
ncbi:TonB-dependent receptor [Leptotrichia sp. OH3620_COT-345]|uniref:TonB-dependent receptor n=1 Tax=Leptotrichia sp. OH3620_COT-345 TaxID=2491048 RepID=UPI000F649C84|nr:TonB-dependent receptor [Leptotrichia sp. OH3620_COT-345]RRD40421.1 TonB-dependent receptor [Leptotrichia sp. OH3620_COT-345]